jgi:hypothetical protein
MTLTKKDLETMQKFVAERDRLKLSIKNIYDADAKIVEYEVRVMNTEARSYGGYDSYHPLKMSREMVLHHLKDRLAHVELALTTYGVELT